MSTVSTKSGKPCYEAGWFGIFSVIGLEQSPTTSVPRCTQLIARPSPASSLKVTDRSFQYASPHLWNQLPFSLREPVSPLNPSFSSPLSPSITTSLFHSKLKTYLFTKSFPP